MMRENLPPFFLSPSHTHSPGQRTRSMEQLTVDTSNLDKGVRGFSTPGTTPVGTPQGTPRMNRSWSKTRLGRRGSEPDLEGARKSCVCLCVCVCVGGGGGGGGGDTTK